MKMRKKIFSMIAACLFGSSLIFVNAFNMDLKAEKRATFSTCWGNGDRCAVTVEPDGTPS
jgi:hypothetical protein